MNRKVAIIDQLNCVGCSKCLKKCPVDAIVGSPNKSHFILFESCIACTLCIDICPTDCISIKLKRSIHYIIKNICNKFNKIIINDIKKNLLVKNTKISYKEKIKRIKKDNVNNIIYYQKKNQLIKKIKEEIKNIIIKKQSQIYKN